jgi:hypothetical protein
MDRDRQTIWNSGSPPEQWIQIDLGAPRSLAAVRLVTSQYPSGATVHQVWVGDSVTNLRLAHEFKGQTQDYQELSYTPTAPDTNVRFIRIVTTASPSWVAWREIEVVAL